MATTRTASPSHWSGRRSRAHRPSGSNESQSRTWENLVGRSRPFWLHWYEPLQESFPGQLGDVDLETFLAAVNRAEPGLIRVEADETTYSLHIILRFELEQRLIEGSLDPKDLPDAWSAGMSDLLGVEVPDDTHGVLQDIHWSQGGDRLLPDLCARQRHLAADLGLGPRGDPGPRRADGGRASCTSSRRGSATTSTRSAASSRRRRRSSG